MFNNLNYKRWRKTLLETLISIFEKIKIRKVQRYGFLKKKFCLYTKENHFFSKNPKISKSIKKNVIISEAITT